MAKASSPVRLQEVLMRSAEISGKLAHRSAAEQIEYWASVGQRISKFLDMETLLSVSSGLARLKVEAIHAQPVNPAAVFNELERARKQGSLSASVSQAGVKYQASLAHPGFLERVETDNSVTVGQFKDGLFIPLPELPDADT